MEIDPKVTMKDLREKARGIVEAHEGDRRDYCCGHKGVCGSLNWANNLLSSPYYAEQERRQRERP